ncbi:ribonuclease H-like domain-containing protein, partial [Tanacetum coccineum]
LACLFAKITIDESNLWHRKLGHINFKNMDKLMRGNLVRATKDEASGILKTFITEIENQLDYKVKVIRSDNGTEFKNCVINQFCEMKGIQREFSIARTPYQNGVAERRNRTLIEAARTMVLVIKPYNKTPYEFIRGRTPLIDFMKPFGCPVTILNTKDNLGKFDGKANEGLFVGYSMLFDVDSLSKSMNYVLVVAGNQTNGIAGTRDNIVAGQAEKKTKPEQEYILIPFYTTDPLISQGPKDNEEDVGMKPTEVNESEASDKGKEDEQDTRSDAAEPSSTNDALSSSVNAAKTSKEHLFEQFSPFKNVFTLLDADLNNLETTMNVSSIPTTRIDKDHPKDQIIGDLDSTI